MIRSASAYALVITGFIGGFAHSGEDIPEPFDRGLVTTGGDYIDLVAERDVAGSSPQQDAGSSTGSSGTRADKSNKDSPRGEQSGQRKTAKMKPQQARVQSYCFSVEGVGQLDCFAMEAARCTEPGSQLLINVRPDSSTEFGTARYGEPYCSAASNPVAPETDAPAEGEPEPPPMPVVTLADFQRLNIAASKIEADSGGFGLRNAHTNFYATSEPQTLNVEMLGQQVSIQAVPVQWTWNYGDGTRAVSLSHPGGPQREFNQELPTTHVYKDTGKFPVNLTTAYRGQYSVNGGPYLPIPGTAQVPSTPTTADIWRSKTRNVADDCKENPNGWACGNPFIEEENSAKRGNE